jgi:hypothetical protein
VINVISGDYSEEWAAVVAADKLHEAALAAIPAASLPSILERALNGSGDVRHYAIKILFEAAPELIVSVMPELREMLLNSQSMPLIAMEIILRLPQPELFYHLEALTELVIGDPKWDDWAYCRLADLLEDAKADDLLSRLVVAAWQSEDPDILDFAFGNTSVEVAKDIFPRVPRSKLLRGLVVLTDYVIGDQWRIGCEYQQLGELLQEAGASDLLARLLAAARRSEKPDILKVAADFPSELWGPTAD